MYCPDCEIRIPFNKAPELTECTLCGNPMRSTVQDLLEFGQYGVAKEIRPTQIEMGTDIEEALEAEQHQIFFAEGGTGIGKSFAYLVPALLMQDKRVVISTAKKNLQRQLYTKDVPFLRDSMGIDFDVCLYKGARNYACWKMTGEVPPQERKKFKRFIDAARNKGEPADLSDWEGEAPYWWDSISVKTCVDKTACPHHLHCRPHPKKAQVVIVNHYLLAIDISKGPGSLIGPYDILIIDEAHQAAEAFRSCYSQQLRHDAGDVLVNSLRNKTDVQTLIDHGTNGVLNSKRVERGFHKIQSILSRIYSEASLLADEKTGILKGKLLYDPLSELAVVAKDVGTRMYRGKHEAHRLYKSGSFADGTVLPEDQVPILIGKLQYMASRVLYMCDFAASMGQFTHVHSNLNAQETKEETFHIYNDENYICTLNEAGIVLQPIEIGKLVGPQLSKVPKKVVISATLAIDEDFSHVRKELGLDHLGDPWHQPKVTEKIYPSPFNMKKQARLYIPRHLPIPPTVGSYEHRAWIHAIATESSRLIEMMGGDAFILFSATTDMHAIRDMFVDGKMLSNLGIPLLVQGDDGDAGKVEQLFRDTPNSVLLGLKSFWEGVDVPGEKLRLVIIPKIPFPVPADPVIKSLSDRAENSFYEVFMPRMLFDLKQGAGRLIRTKQDYGVVAILDPRIWSGYGIRKIEQHNHYMETLEHSPPLQRRPRNGGYGKEIIDTLGFPLYQDSFTKIQTFVNRCKANAIHR
jgi:ATP-dependent DNA helicase DinG